MKDPGDTLQIREKNGTAAVSKKAKAEVSTFKRYNLLSYRQRSTSWKNCLAF